MENAAEVNLKHSSNLVGDSNETNFPNKLPTVDKFQCFVKLLRIIHQLI